MPRQNSTPRFVGGCGFAALTALFGCTLLVLNGGVVAAVYFAIAENGPSIMKNTGLSQLVLFLGPVILLVLEWSVMDFAGRHSGSDAKYEKEKAN